MSINDRGRKDGPGMAMPAENIVPLKGTREQRARYRVPPEITDNAKEHLEPFNAEAEEAYLGSCLINHAAVKLGADDVLPQHFYLEKHRTIWETILRLHRRGVPSDVILLTDALRERGKLEELGGVGAITRLANLVPTSENAEHYLDIIRRTAKQRESMRTWQAFGDALTQWNLDDATQFWPDVRKTLDMELFEGSGVDAIPMLTGDEVEEIPPATPILGDLLYEDCVAILYGPSQRWKSFIALDWALSIASGRTWLGRRTKPGHVVYIAAEGGRGLGKRVTAWRLHHGVARTPPNFHLIPVAVNLLDPAEVQKLIARIRRGIEDEAPILIVIDTLARSMPGGDENAGKDSSRVFDSVDAVRKAFDGSCVLVVAHPGKNEDLGIRGWSGWFSNTDIVMRVSGGDNRARLEPGTPVNLISEKPKEAEQFADITLTTQIMRWANNDGTQNLSSLAVVPSNAEVAPREVRPLRDPVDEKLLRVLQLYSRPVSTGDLASRFKTDTGMSKSSFNGALRNLKAAGLIEGVVGGYQLKTPLAECNQVQNGAITPTCTEV